jgi:tellurium resistance protein TerD
MIDLKKEKESAPVRSEICVGLGWYPNQRSWNAKKDKHCYDLDLSAFMLGADGKLVSDDFFVFYNNTDSPDGAVFLQSDNRTGVGAGDDETLVVDLSIVDPRVTEIVFVASVFEPKVSFGEIRKVTAHVYDATTRKDMDHCMLHADCPDAEAAVLGHLFRQEGNWYYKHLHKREELNFETIVEHFSGKKLPTDEKE